MYSFSHQYGYNAAGDRTSLTDAGDAWSYTYNEDHRLSQYSKTGFAAAFAYDANGNARFRNQTVGGTTSHEYVYDAEDRLTAVKQNGATVATYAYDGLGRRVKVVEGAATTYFVYSGLSLAYTKVGTSVTKYVYASGLLVARFVDGVAAYAHQDALGSVRGISDGNANEAYVTSYKPFGAEYGEGGSSRLKFTGQQKDATGLYYLYRRFYDPDLGRFLSQDPILGHLTVPQSLDRYVYTVNNPLRYVDPTGEDWWNPLSWAADVAGAAAAVGDWWASSSIWDKLDMAMTVLGFIPGLDVISDAYFLGRAIVDVIEGRGSWADVAMNAAFLLLPAVGGAAAFKLIKKFANVGDSAGDIGRTAPRAAKAADGAKAVGKADGAASPGPIKSASTTNPGQMPTRTKSGSFSGESIPARSSARDFTDVERLEINRIGSTTGCHTCGALLPGTKSGNFIPDHMPPTALNAQGLPQRLYPQCLACSRAQGLEIANLLRSPRP